MAKKRWNTRAKVNLILLLFAFVLILLFAAPGLLWLINQSFTMTKNNYHEMQTHFEVLYKNKKLPQLAVF